LRRGELGSDFCSEECFRICAPKPGVVFMPVILAFKKGWGMRNSRPAWTTYWDPASRGEEDVKTH
jgi:hypothetical protein